MGLGKTCGQCHSTKSLTFFTWAILSDTYSLIQTLTDDRFISFRRSYTSALSPWRRYPFFFSISASSRSSPSGDCATSPSASISPISLHLFASLCSNVGRLKLPGYVGTALTPIPATTSTVRAGQQQWLTWSLISWPWVCLFTSSASLSSQRRRSSSWCLCFPWVSSSPSWVLFDSSHWSSSLPLPTLLVRAFRSSCIQGLLTVNRGLRCHRILEYHRSTCWCDLCLLAGYPFLAGAYFPQYFQGNHECSIQSLHVSLECSDFSVGRQDLSKTKGRRVGLCPPGGYGQL